MRFIGNKENLVERIKAILDKNKVKGESFFDFFSGTTSVAKFFKKEGYSIISNDLLYLSYCLQRAYIENNENLIFSSLISKVGNKTNTLFAEPLDIALDYLNSLKPKKGFIYNNYTPTGTKDLDKPRMYFSDNNGAKIDAIRIEIENLKKDNILNENEYYFLLATLIESVPFYSNIAGVYAAFHKKWDNRALKDFTLKRFSPIISYKQCHCHIGNSIDLIKKYECDILYLDPPYNERQYAPNYHLLETIAKYDNPSIYGVAGLRNYAEQKSDFCNKSKALNLLDFIAKEASYKFLVLSYNSEGIMPMDSIKETLEKYGEVKLEEIEYTRFKSNSKGNQSNKRKIKELVYILYRK